MRSPIFHARTLVLTLLCGAGCIYGSVIVSERWSASCDGVVSSVTTHCTAGGKSCTGKILFQDGREFSFDPNADALEDLGDLVTGDVVRKKSGEFFMTVNGVRRPWRRTEAGFYFLIMAAGSLGLVAMLADRLASRGSTIPGAHGLNDPSASLHVAASASAHDTGVGLRASRWRANLKFLAAIPPICMFALLPAEHGALAVIGFGVGGGAR